jgi:hypothetical protein
MSLCEGDGPLFPHSSVWLNANGALVRRLAARESLTLEPLATPGLGDLRRVAETLFRSILETRMRNKRRNCS